MKGGRKKKKECFEGNGFGNTEPIQIPLKQFKLNWTHYVQDKCPRVTLNNCQLSFFLQNVILSDSGAYTLPGSLLAQSQAVKGDSFHTCELAPID